MSVPAPPARMELSVLMVPTSTPVNVLKVHETIVYFRIFWLIPSIFLVSIQNKIYLILMNSLWLSRLHRAAL